MVLASTSTVKAESEWIHNSSDLGAAAAAAVACSSRKKERETEPGRHSSSLKLIFKCLVDRASAIEVAAFAAAVATVSAGRGDEKGEF